MNAVIMSFVPNESRVYFARESYETYESSRISSMKSTRKAKDKLHKTCERASETRERTLHRQEQNRMCMVSMRESRDSDRF